MAASLCRWLGSATTTSSTAGSCNQVRVVGVGLAVEAFDRLCAPFGRVIDDCGNSEMVRERGEELGVNIPAAASEAGNADTNGYLRHSKRLSSYGLWGKRH